MVLRKEELTDRFRFHLWEDSIKLAPTEEDRLVAELLLEDERHSFEEDKLLEQTDIGMNFYFISRQNSNASLVEHDTMMESVFL